MLPRKALWIPALASLGLLIVLGVAGWSFDSSPISSPASGGSLNASTPQSVTIVPTPDVADITVKGSSSDATTTTTTTRTTQPKPPPVQQPPPAAQQPTTTEPPQQGLLVNEGARCDPEGANGIGLIGEKLVCRKDPQRGDRLRWQKA
ncbi:hypothetical protein [Lentzea flaviverrucosa]|uniref:Uncharacterized protein n=1 Tax=Lentzea flaviverrucosa TaxID=200379 RepID=A0A1H9PN35_9PSEU|nr:hypothetical protein [Lentzea flaviverrucosa]RDI29789.1 hypothetical protein DFR72_105208 [Lentzea flaviverrucosa]SER49588.1 hypothetical protein SAMN05216195_105364 [Lentzea flaviverrucosa]